jgi:glycosyltransferase involved in cell wall biosynthesis
LSNLPLVSVVMPNLNKGNYIKNAIESVLSQTYQNYELIIVDNGSTDGSLNLIQKYAAKYKKILFVEENHRGPSAARNLGIERARGELIAFIDSDDIYHKDKLRQQVQLFGDNRNFVCYTNGWIIDEFGASTGEIYNTDLARIPKGGREGIIFRQLLRRYDYIIGASMMIPKEFLKLERFDINFSTVEDPDLFVRLAWRIPFRYISEALYGYRVWSGNTWASTSNRDINLKNILALHKKWLKVFKYMDPADREYVEKQIHNLEFRIIIHELSVFKYFFMFYDRTIGMRSARIRTLVKHLNDKWLRL